MKKLTPALAKEIFFSLAPKIQPQDHQDFIMVHSEKVAKVAKMLAQKMGLDDQLLEIAGWVHDLGYLKSGQEHAEQTILILQDLGYEIDQTLQECILNHGNGKTPQTKEGKIFQLADKLSIFDADTIKIMLEHHGFPWQESDYQLFPMMSAKAIELLHNFSKNKIK